MARQINADWLRKFQNDRKTDRSGKPLQLETHIALQKCLGVVQYRNAVVDEVTRWRKDIKNTPLGTIQLNMINAFIDTLTNISPIRKTHNIDAYTLSQGNKAIATYMGLFYVVSGERQGWYTMDGMKKIFVAESLEDLKYFEDISLLKDVASFLKADIIRAGMSSRFETSSVMCYDIIPNIADLWVDVVDAIKILTFKKLEEIPIAD